MATTANGAAKGNKVEFWNGKILYPAIVILLVLSAFFALAILPRLLEKKSALVAKPAPEFALPILPGTTEASGAASIDLAALKGHVVVLDFWAPWCDPCREEMPIVDSVARKLAGEDVRFYGLMIDGSRERAIQFLQEKSIGYAQLDDRGGKTARAYGVSMIPTLIVIDKQGMVRTVAGSIGGDDLEKAIRAVL